MHVLRINKYAKLPITAEGNAGYDLFSCERVVIPPGERRLIKTGICIQLPFGYYGHISDRSGMAFKNGGHCLGKIIDPSYRGEVGILLLNTDQTRPIFVEIGDRPAQLIIQKYFPLPIVEVEDLTETDRGADGFGSTGK